MRESPVSYRAAGMFKADNEITDRYIVIDTTINQLKIYQNSFMVESAESLEPIAEADTQPVKTVKAKLSDEQAFTQLADTDLIATFPITAGKEEFIRRGYWKVSTSVELPIWRYDKSLLETGVRGKKSLSIPGGPNNPVGVMWHGLTRRGIGIHGTSSPETIGRSKSAGCIRLSNWDVVKLPALIRPGTKVWLK